MRLPRDLIKAVGEGVCFCWRHTLRFFTLPFLERMYRVAGLKRRKSAKEEESYSDYERPKGDYIDYSLPLTSLF